MRWATRRFHDPNDDDADAVDVVVDGDNKDTGVDAASDNGDDTEGGCNLKGGVDDEDDGKIELLLLLLLLPVPMTRRACSGAQRVKHTISRRV